MGSKIVDLLVTLQLQPSKSEARRLLKNGGVYLNNQKVTDENYTVVDQDLIEGQMLLVSAERKTK